MSNPTIVMTGPPATGKATRGQQLADALRLSSVSKDATKEVGTADWKQVDGLDLIAVIQASEAVL
jgi:shikimate kinase